MKQLRKTEGSYTLIFLIDVKDQFSIQNRYLKNGIVNSLILFKFSGPGLLYG